MGLSQDQILELLAFLITSARALETEPHDYGQMRLMAAATQLSRDAAPNVEPALQAILLKFEREIPLWQKERIRDPAAYQAFIEECSRDLARYLKEKAADDQLSGQ